jgi:hypothetical protein
VASLRLDRSKLPFRQRRYGIDEDAHYGRCQLHASRDRDGDEHQGVRSGNLGADCCRGSGGQPAAPATACLERSSV